MALQLLIILAIHIGLTFAYPFTIPRDGEINDPGGFSGLSYHSKRWEPLCASIVQPFDTFDMSTYCVEPIARFTNDTSRTFGLYERGGTRLEGAIIGGGRELCMCFSVSTIAGLGNDMCFYFAPTGDLDMWWELHIDHRIASSVRSGSAKALPHCADVDIASLEGSWSATAIQPSITGPVSNIGPKTTTATLTPTVANLTITSNRIYTNSQGQTLTEPVVVVTQAPVVVVQQSGGLSRQEKIALGVGLGIGLPSLIIGITGLLIKQSNDRERERRMYADSMNGRW